MSRLGGELTEKEKCNIVDFDFFSYVPQSAGSRGSGKEGEVWGSFQRDSTMWLLCCCLNLLLISLGSCDTLMTKEGESKHVQVLDFYLSENAAVKTTKVC